MTSNVIEIGSAIPITPEIDEISEDIFGLDRPSSILIVEGETDKDLIEKYIFLKKIEINFSIRTAKMAEGGDRGGKKVAIDYYRKNIGKQDIILLIVRDYDFICSENIEDSNIFYYDYYEIENYILEEKVLKHACISNNISTEEINKVIEFLNSSDNEILSPLFECSKLRIFRELHKSDKTELKLDSEVIEVYCEFAKDIDIKGCLIGKKPEIRGSSFKERIDYYLYSKLHEIDSDLYSKINVQLERFEIGYPNSIWDFLKYYYKGKDVIKFISDLFQYLGILSCSLKEINTKKLFNTYIFQSELYKEKMEAIFESF